jgi:hypothetical protein
MTSSSESLLSHVVTCWPTPHFQLLFGVSRFSNPRHRHRTTTNRRRTTQSNAIILTTYLHSQNTLRTLADTFTTALCLESSTWKEDMTRQLLKTASLLLFGVLCCSACMPNSGNHQVSAFVVPHSSSTVPFAVTPTRLLAQSANDNDDNDNNTPTNAPGLNRRQALLAGVALITASTLTASTPPAKATYTMYTRREQDWQERIDKKEINVSSARSLRGQLREIAPMNSESSRIFCPNGTPSAVSPLMENKCGDRQAIPSVYGRSEDIVGNSIPGFAGYSSGFGPSSLSAAEVGGFPTYKFK